MRDLWIWAEEGLRMKNLEKEGISDEDNFQLEDTGDKTMFLEFEKASIL